MMSTRRTGRGRLAFRRRGLTALAVLASGAAVAGGSLAAAAAPAAAAPGPGPAITIRVAGLRTAESGPPGPPVVQGLAGVTYRATASGFTPVTCTSTAAGLCVLNVTANKTYTLTETSVPAGWYADPSLGAGSGGQVTPRPYDSLTVKVGAASVTVPAGAGSSPNFLGKGAYAAASTDGIAANQQIVADRFFKLGLVPKQVNVREIVWKWTPNT